MFLFFTEFVTSTVGKYIIAVGIVLSVISGAYLLGRSHEKSALLRTQYETSVRILRERGAIDDRVKGSSDAELCGALGGVLNDRGECL